MQNLYILIGSITTAHNAQRILGNNNIKSYVLRAPAHKRKGGCGYCIKINKNDFDAASSILYDANISFDTVWSGSA